ncbi:hypothetical protein C1H46_038568 [Malus baccata]|uniref:Uncharacterized protein n=1 Tax=Malus baccata TaxID=106549 RepID=A0A540KNX8_MALBA|nr:hypothetical protein C1H46_038568 [Malus baccata]
MDDFREIEQTLTRRKSKILPMHKTTILSRERESISLLDSPISERDKRDRLERERGRERGREREGERDCSRRNTCQASLFFLYF